MKRIALAAAAMTALITTGAQAHEIGGGAMAHAHPQTRAHSHSGPTTTAQVRIDCYRGPWTETIWDHPRGIFIDDLMNLGYDYSNASAIAYRICRDVRALGQPEVLRANLLNAIAQQPPGTHRNNHGHGHN